jgi:CRP-like cAMP-binding protein
LEEGDHFGEIQLVYGCRRTATVISRNYNTLAKMIQARYTELIAEFPEYEKALTKHIISEYNDKKIQFVKDMVKRVSYFKGADDEILFRIMFSLKPSTMEEGSIVL